MRQTQLGPTDVEVSAIGMGAMHLSLKGRPPEDKAISVVHEALDRGVTFFDTADAYCIDEGDKHHNERIVQKAIDAYAGDTEDVVVATKGGIVRPGGRWERDGSPEHLRKTIRESAEILDGIQLWQHHAPDANVPVTTSLKAAKEAQEQGLIRWVGVSNYSVEQLEKARRLVDIVSVQNQFSLWHRKPLEDGVLDYCTRHEITFLPWRPLGGSKHAKGMGDEPVLSRIGNEHNASPHQVALAWLMAQSPVVLPIPGVSRKATLIDSLNSLQVTLSSDELEEISASVGQ